MQLYKKILGKSTVVENSVIILHTNYNGMVGHTNILNLLVQNKIVFQ